MKFLVILIFCINVSIVISCSTNDRRLNCCEKGISGRCCCADKNGYPHLIRNCKKHSIHLFHTLTWVVCRKDLDRRKKIGSLNCNGCENGFKCLNNDWKPSNAKIWLENYQIFNIIINDFISLFFIFWNKLAKIKNFTRIFDDCQMHGKIPNTQYSKAS
jgi:hypothetical protein